MLTLRAAQPEDMSFLFGLYADTRSEELSPLQWTEEAMQRFLRMQYDLQARSYASRYPGAERRIAVEEGRPVGHIITASDNNAIVIVDLAVVRECRNRGIGSELIGWAIEWARRAHNRVQLHVLVNNPARRLYERLGFKPIEERYPYLFMETAHPAEARQEHPPHDPPLQTCLPMPRSVRPGAIMSGKQALQRIHF